MAIFRHKGEQAQEGHHQARGQAEGNFATAQSRVASVLEQSRQNVKYIVKAEREGEKITAEIVNLRLK